MKNHICIIVISLIAISYLAIRPNEAEAGTLFPCGQEGDFCCLFGDKCAEGLACIDFICEPTHLTPAKDFPERWVRYATHSVERS
ncbi:MAG: hypothetical protein L0Y68_03405 [Candidatus Dadabacteria bacterium]|nr:hypothetical protein [Candidatus Dadabacteria bacterium]